MSLGIFKKGKGNFNNDNKTEEDDFYILKNAKSTSELINNGEGTDPFITLKDLYDYSSQGLIYSGGITWEDGYNYKVNEHTYNIRGNIYTSTPTIVTISDGDSLDRIDVVVGTFKTNGDAEIKVISGIPNANPVKPEINPETQVELTFIQVDANTTEPTGLTNTIIYDENTEFATSSVGSATVDFDSTVDPSSNTKCILVTDMVAGDSIDFYEVGTINPLLYPTFQFNIESVSGSWADGGALQLAWFEGTSRVSDWLFLEGDIDNPFGTTTAFNSNESGWHTVSIPREMWNFTSTTTTTLRIRKVYDSPISFKLDLIRFQDGIPVPNIQTGITDAPIDGKSYNRTDGVWTEDLGGAETALQTTYDNTDSTLVATNVKDALDELDSDINGLSDISTQEPVLTDFIPDTYLPSTTGNFVVEGDYFVPAMVDNINSVDGILVESHTINYATFVNSQKILINLTTSAIEGSYNLTLNNGLVVVFADVLQVVQGTVYKPLSTEWEFITVSEPDVSLGDSVKLTLFGSNQKVKWLRPLDYTKDFTLSFKYKRSVLGLQSDTLRTNLVRIGNNITDDWYQTEFQFQTDGASWNDAPYLQTSDDGLRILDPLQGNPPGTPIIDRVPTFENAIIEFRYLSGTMYYYLNNILQYTSARVINEDMYLYVNVEEQDITDIKYIDLNDGSGTIQDPRDRTSDFINDGADGTSTYVEHDELSLQKEITASYTLTSADSGYTIFINSASAVTITVPALTDNFECDFYNEGAGLVTFTNSVITLTTPDGTTLATNKVCALLKKLSTTTYILKGEMA